MSSFFIITHQFTKGYVLSIDFFEFFDEKSVIRLSKTSYCRVSSKKKGLKKSDQTNNPTKSTQPTQILLNFEADQHLIFLLKQCDMQATEVLL